jgi:hypothetical protein
MGDTSQGSVLRGQVQGVKRGVGVIIYPNGSISFDPTTATGVVRTNNASAFNSYIWPNANGVAGQVLTATADGSLLWDNIPNNIFSDVFTAKGQLIVGAGVQAFVLQNVGINTAFLVADSTTPSGLIYTNNSTSSVLLPVGTSEQRDCYCVPTDGPLTGQFRYSTTYDTLEFYNGTQWVQVAASDITVKTFVKQTVPLTGTASAEIVGGSTANRQNAPLAGYFRYNTTLLVMEFYDGTKWVQIASSDILSETYVKQTVPFSGTPSAVLIPGTSLERQNSPLPGYFRYNTDEDVPEFYDGTNWNTFIHSILPGTTGLTFTGVPTPEAGIVQVGGTLALGNGGTGATTQPSAANNILPSQSGNTGEYLVTNGTNVSWQPVSSSLVGGTGIDVIPGSNGQATIAFNGGQAIYFPPIYLVPGESVTWGSATGLGPYIDSLGPYEINYPAGAAAATLQTRTRWDVNSFGGVDYSGTGFVYVNSPKTSIQITGEALPSIGTFSENLSGIVGGYESGVVFPQGVFMIRTDEIELTNPAGGSFFITLQFEQTSSGPNSVVAGLPQFYLQPFVST